MGPTVCELEGPMPILKRSKTLMAIKRSPILQSRPDAAERVRPGRATVPRGKRTPGCGPGPGKRAIAKAELGEDAERQHDLGQIGRVAGDRASA